MVVSITVTAPGGHLETSIRPRKGDCAKVRAAPAPLSPQLVLIDKRQAQAARCHLKPWAPATHFVPETRQARYATVAQFFVARYPVNVSLKKRGLR